MSDLFIAVKQWLLTQLKDPGVLNTIGGILLAGGAIFKNKLVAWSKGRIKKWEKKHKIEQMAKHAIPDDFATKGKQVNKVLSDLRTALESLCFNLEMALSLRCPNLYSEYTALTRV